MKQVYFLAVERRQKISSHNNTWWHCVPPCDAGYIKVVECALIQSRPRCRRVGHNHGPPAVQGAYGHNFQVENRTSSSDTRPKEGRAYYPGKGIP